MKSSFNKDSNFERSLDQLLDVEFDGQKAYKRFLAKRGKVIGLKKIITIATLAASFLGAFFYYNLLSPKSETYTSLNTSTRFILPDGSLLDLASNSQVKLDPNFSKENRLLDLKGKAYFEVEKNEKPFIINSDELETVVTGTKLVVDAKNSKVSVLEGTVNVSFLDKIHKVEARQEFNAKNEGVINQANFSLENWLEVNMTYENSALSEVISDIEVKHKVTFEGNLENLSDCKLTSKDLSKESLQTLIEILQKTFNAKIVKKDVNTYKILSLTCS